MSRDNVTHCTSIIAFITKPKLSTQKQGNKLNTNGEAHDNRQN